MRFDAEAGTHAARQQAGGGYNGVAGGGAYGGPTGAYGGPTGAPGSAYGGPTGAYGGPTGAYGGPTGAYGGPTGAYGGPTGYGGGPANGAAPPPEAMSLKDCPAADLLERLPRMQRLLARMLACVPEGAAAYNPLCLVRGAAGACAGDMRSAHPCGCSSGARQPNAAQ